MVTYILVTQIDQGVKGYQVPSRYVAHISTTKPFVELFFAIKKPFPLVVEVCYPTTDATLYFLQQTNRVLSKLPFGN